MLPLIENTQINIQPCKNELSNTIMGIKGKLPRTTLNNSLTRFILTGVYL